MSRYSDILLNQIESQNIQLNELANLCEVHGLDITTSYISKLKNGKMPPPSPEVTRVLAEVLGLNKDEMVIIGYLERAPQEFIKMLEPMKFLFKE